MARAEPWPPWLDLTWLPQTLAEAEALEARDEDLDPAELQRILGELASLARWCVPKGTWGRRTAREETVRSRLLS
jgi:hypothetical protein